MDKRLSNLRQDETLQKAKNGLALSLKELAIATGWGYSQWRAWKAQGLPLIAKKLPVKKAMEWVEEFEKQRRIESVQKTPSPSISARFHRKSQAKP